MIKRTFKYCATHKADEEYMRQMCSKGWAATKLFEGFWSFEKCKNNQYCYRVCYTRGKTKDEIKKLKEQFSAKDIEFVSSYSFWTIFRSENEFEIYNGTEELEICKSIYSPMPIGAIISYILTIVAIILSLKISLWFLIPGAITSIYAAICTWLAISYKKLIKSL